MEFLDQARIHRAKRAFSTRRVPSQSIRTVQGGGLKPRAGDLVLARVVDIGSHRRLELPTGRKALLFPADEIVLAYGNRYAPDQYEAYVPESLDPCHLAAAGGIAGLAASWHDRMVGPTTIAPVGLLGDLEGRVINVGEHALPAQAGPLPASVFAVFGTSMNAGKSTTVAAIVKGLTLAGHRVGVAKVTGTGAGGDLWLTRDHGAAESLDFTDAGFATTFGADPEELIDAAANLLRHLRAQGCMVAVVEIADGLYQRETAALASSPRFLDLLDGTFFAAGDAMGAVSGAGTRLLTDPASRGAATVSLLITCALALFGLQVLLDRQSERFALSYVRRLRLAFMSHVLRRPADSTSTRFGLVMSRVVNDFSAVKLWLSDGLVGSVVGVSVCATVLAYFALRMPDVFAAAAVVLGLWLLVAGLCLTPIHRVIARCRRARGQIAGKAGTMLNGQLTLLAHGRHDGAMRALERRSDDLHDALTGRATWAGALRASGDFVFPAVASVLAFGLVFAAPAPLAADQLGVMLVALGLLTAELRVIARAVDLLLAHRIAMRRVRGILDRPAIDLATGRKRLRRRGAGRDLDVAGLVVDGCDAPLSFTVAAGQVACPIVLPPRCVTEVFRRVSGLAAGAGGRVSLNGRGIDDVRRRDWLRAVCWVSPDLPLVAGTVARNATLGSASAVDAAERDRLFTRFGLHADLLGAAVGEDSRLDVRLALILRAVRTLMRRPSVVLVDEPEFVVHADIWRAFLSELRHRGTTVVLASPVYPVDTRVAVVRSPRAPS